MSKREGVARGLSQTEVVNGAATMLSLSIDMVERSHRPENMICAQRGARGFIALTGCFRVLSVALGRFNVERWGSRRRQLTMDYFVVARFSCHHSPKSPLISEV